MIIYSNTYSHRTAIFYAAYSKRYSNS